MRCIARSEIPETDRADWSSAAASSIAEPATPTGPAWILLAAMRQWRGARDSGQPVQPSIFVTLRPFGAGLLAPAIDSVLTLWEGRYGRRFAIANAQSELSEDERHVLHCLVGVHEPSGEQFLDTAKNLAVALNVALCSTRYLILEIWGSIWTKNKGAFITAATVEG